MNEVKNNHWKWLHIRLREKDYARIKSKFSQSTERKLSAFVRKVLLDKELVFKTRNQSLDDLVAGLLRLKNDLNAIGNNYNQVVKRLHSLQDKNELQSWLFLNQNAQQILTEKIEQIKLKIFSINDQWLQS